jgi:small subunit ribosomal protein S2
MKGDGTFELLAKKEAVRREKDRLRLEKFLGGIRSLDELPKALFIVDTYREHIAVREGVKLGIPIIGIVDTNSDPGGIDYVLPGNDDALRSIRLFVSKIAESIIDGASLRSDTEEGEMAAVMSAGGSVGEEILAAAEGRKEEKD